MRRNNWLALLLALVMVLTMVPTAAATAYISEEDVSLGAYGTEPDVFVAPAVQANSSAVSVLQVSGQWPAATKTVSSTGDFPLTLRDGDIVETGNHEELLARGGFYAELYNSQFAGAE